MSRKSPTKIRWGWIAFGTGLATCVVAGAVAGVLLGTGGSSTDQSEAQRVAALALDASGLNNDALALSQAIEDAIAREALESEAAMLRDELAQLELRAIRIQARADAMSGRGPNAEPIRTVSARTGRQVRKGLRAINASLAVLERDIVSSLESVLDSPPSDPSGTAALDEVMQTLERQEETLTALAERLTEREDNAEAGANEDADSDGDADLISGRVPLLPDVADEDYALEFEYELSGLDAEINDSGAPPGQAIVSGSLTGDVTLTNTDPRQRAEVASPNVVMTLLWAERDAPPPAAHAELTDGVSGMHEGSDPCRFGFRGERYCALVSIGFEVDDPDPTVVLRPEESADLEAQEAASELLVEEEAAEVVTDFLRSNRPDLVQVDLIAPLAFKPACLVPGRLDDEGLEDNSDFNELTVDSTVGLLRGDGRTIFRAEEAHRTVRDEEAWRYGEDAGEAEGPECFEGEGDE